MNKSSQSLFRGFVQEFLPFEEETKLLQLEVKANQFAYACIRNSRSIRETLGGSPVLGLAEILLVESENPTFHNPPQQSGSDPRKTSRRRRNFFEKLRFRKILLSVSGRELLRNKFIGRESRFVFFFLQFQYPQAANYGVKCGYYGD